MAFKQLSCFIKLNADYSAKVQGLATKPGVRNMQPE